MKVFRQDGTTLGQGRVSTGLTEVAMPLVPGTTTVPDGAWVVLEPAPRVVLEATEVPETIVLVSMLVRVWVTGQMVVETAMVTTVVTTDELPGHEDTVGAHWVMVDVLVVKMVDVLMELVTMILVVVAVVAGSVSLLVELTPLDGAWLVLLSAAELAEVVLLSAAELAEVVLTPGLTVVVVDP
jgi:hypothetical protein